MKVIKLLLTLWLAGVFIPLYSQNWVPLDKGLNASLYHLLPENDNNLLYVSGDMISDGNNIPMRGIAKWNGIKWDSVGDSHNPYMTNCGFCKYQDTLIVSGTFEVDPWYFDLGKLRGSKFDILPGTKKLGVYCFLERNGILYMGGWFNKCGNDSTYLLGKYDGVTLSGMTPMYDGFSWGDVITCMVFFNDTLYVGGNFHMSPQPNIADFAKWDGYNLLPVTPEYNSGYCMIETMAVFQNELYIGGSFSKAYGFIGDYIMKWDGHHLYEVGGGTNERVTSMKVFNNELYVGGWFSEVDSSPCNNIAKWNGTQWTCLNNDIFDDFFCIRDICIYKDELYVAGSFRKIGNDSISAIAKYNHPLMGIKENIKEESNISISPNPAINQLTLELLQPNTLKNGMISIYDIQGQLLLQQTIQQRKTVINISNLAGGLYFLSVKSEEGVVVKKFIKE